MSGDETRPQPARPGDDLRGISAPARSQAVTSSQVPNSEQPMVCGRSIHGDLTYIPKAEYAGEVLFFCSDYCLRAYQSDPHRFYAAHRRLRSGD